MTTPTPADRLALAVCRALTTENTLPSRCRAICNACRSISQAHARELSAILRERHGHSETADWLDGIGAHQPTTETP